MLRYKDGTIRISGNACVVTSDCSPKFQNWTYDMYQNDPSMRFLEPMLASPLSPDNIPEKSTIAEKKFDGHRALMFITKEGNRFFSRRVSKKTGWYAENTDNLPHLRDYVGLKGFVGTVLDGEITMPTGVFADVQGVTGALPETALANQIEKGFAIFNAFDILYYKGINIQMMPLWKRKLYLAKVLRHCWMPCIQEVMYYSLAETADEFRALKEKDNHGKWYLEPIPRIVPSFNSLLTEMFESGEEGLIIKNIHAPYLQKRSKDMGKLKGEKTYDCVVMGFEEPTKFYDGKSLDEGKTWNYWVCYDDDDSVVEMERDKKWMDEAGEYAPVTKPYAMGWIGALIVGVYKNGKLVEVAKAKGISDADQEFIKKNRKKLIGNQVVEVLAQEIIDTNTGSLRHPRFNRWRNDKNKEDCTWENYLGTEK